MLVHTVCKYKARQEDDSQLHVGGGGLTPQVGNALCRLGSEEYEIPYLPAYRDSLLPMEIGVHHRVHILVEMKQSEWICPLSWSVLHCNSVRDGNCGERGWTCSAPPTLTSQG